MIPDLKIIVFTMFGDETHYYKMIDLGVRGFILKSSGIAELEKAIREVMAGESFFSNEILRKIISGFSRKQNQKPSEPSGLTDREMEVLQLICEGFNNEEIAQKLFISAMTVKTHRAKLLEKTGSKNTPTLILYALKNKLIEI
jgi:DNA-binding NarL/FixJ family response regulator